MRCYLDRFALERDVSAGYVDQLRYALDRFSKWFGRSPIAGELTDDAVNRWIVSMLAEGISRQTIKSYRRHLLVLWRAACEDGAAEIEPRKIRKVKAELPPPECPDLALILEMVRLSQAIPGVFRRSRVNRAAFWRAYLCTAWDTGLRLGDLRRLRREQINPDGSLNVVQHKTGWPIPCWLQPETMSAIADTFPPERKTIFGDALSGDQTQKQFRAIRNAAGITRDGIKLFRKASATAVEIATPGGAMHHLGHKTPGLAYRHYVDLAKVQQNKARPPKLA